MADSDKKTVPAKPVEGGPTERKAGSSDASVVKPNLDPADAKRVDAEPTSAKPAVAATKASDKASPETIRPRVGPGSEWTASDDRGPLGRAEDEIDAGLPAASRVSKPASTTETAKTGAAVSDSKTPPVGIGSPATPHLAKTKTDAGDETNISKSAGPAAITTIPPVDAAKDPGDTGRPAKPAPAAQSSTPASPTSAQPETKRSLWPVAAALIVGAVIGAGSAAFVYRGYADDTQPDPKVVDLTTRIAALEKRPDPQAAIGALKSSVTALDNQVAAIRQNRGAAPATPQPQAGAPRTAAPQPVEAPQAAHLGEIDKKVAELQAKVDQLKPGDDIRALEEKVGTLQRELDQAKSAAAAAQASVTAVQGQQKEIAGRVMMPALAVVADSLVQRIDHGQPYATQVDALAALGADPAKVSVLRQNATKGVPSAPVLAAKFQPLAQPIEATTTKAPPNAGLGERLKSNMLSIVSIRRADDTSGDDLPSRVAHIQAALAHDDVAGALDALGTLPPEARAKAEAWGALAKTHVDAMNAARALQQDAIAALGSKKS